MMRGGPFAGATILLAGVLCMPSAARAQPGLRLDASGHWQQETPPPAPGSDEASIAEARRHLAEGNADKAKEILDDYIEAHKNGDSPLLARAYLLRGDATTALGNEYQALYDYEKGVIERFPSSPEYVTALERELEIGIRYVNGRRHKWLGMRIWPGSDIGEEILTRIHERLPGSALGERAVIELADFYYRKRDLELAGIAYEMFLVSYPNSQYRMKAMERRVYAAIARFKGPRYDGSSLIDAQALIKRFSALYPEEAGRAGLDDALIARLDESGAAELLETARWYLGRGDEASARYTLRRLVTKHRSTASANVALDIMGKKGWLEGTNAPPQPLTQRDQPAGPPARGGERP